MAGCFADRGITLRTRLRNHRGLAMTGSKNCRIFCSLFYVELFLLRIQFGDRYRSPTTCREDVNLCGCATFQTRIPCGCFWQFFIMAGGGVRVADADDIWGLRGNRTVSEQRMRK